MNLVRLQLAALCCLFAIAHAAEPPNIIVILCDDLGFGDTGPSHQNERRARNDRSIPWFATPQLDVLARQGVLKSFDLPECYREWERKKLRQIEPASAAGVPGSLVDFEKRAATPEPD